MGLNVKSLMRISLVCALLTISTSYEFGKNRRSLYRAQVDPHAGGKIPESYKYRKDLNKVDAKASTPEAQTLSQALKNTYLPEKISESDKDALEDDAPLVVSNNQQNDISETSGEDGFFSFPSTLVNFPSTDFDQGFSFNPAFDAHKLSSTFSSPSGDFGNHISVDESVGYKPLDDEKPHLLTTDPYETGGFGKPEVDFNIHEPAPYQPEVEEYFPSTGSFGPPLNSYEQPQNIYEPPHNAYEQPHNSYEQPHNSYEQPHNSYDLPPTSYGPPQDTYAPPSDSYGPPPYKPVGPILLERRPYEPTEIKPVIVATEPAYTSFDCRKVPHHDKYFADPEAGCRVYHFCHADGRQETFHCGYGTVFNEYLGTCDHSQAVYCKGGEGYKPPEKHYKPRPSYHQPEPYHTPEPHYGHEVFHNPEPHFQIGFDGFSRQDKVKSRPLERQPTRPLPLGGPEKFDFDFGNAFKGFSSESGKSQIDSGFGFGDEYFGFGKKFT